ncbi:MAG: hypothetical protein ABUS79_00620 [Pseudomonadota bacterium]
MLDSKRAFYRGLFRVAAVYDLILGFVFTFFGGAAYGALGIEDQMPAGGYVPLLGAFILVLGTAYLLISRADLPRNRDLILVGTLFKLAFSSVAIAFWVTGRIPHVAFGFFGLADLVFFALMVECLLRLRAEQAQPPQR